MRTRPAMSLSLVVGAGVFAWLMLTGLDLRSACLATGALAAQTLGGAYLWARVRDGSGARVSAVELLGVGWAVGSVLSMIAGVLLRPWVPAGWGWIVPSLVIAVVWLLRRVRGSRRSVPSTLNVGVTLGLVAGIVLGLAGTVVNLARYPLTWVGELSTYHPDMLFFEGLASSVALYGPTDSIFMTGSELRYHWFSYAWMGQLTVSLDLDSFAGLTRVLPVATVVAGAAIASAWAGRRAEQRWVPVLAAVLVTAGGYVGAAYGTLLNFDSPSQAVTTVWMLALTYVLVEYLTGELSRRALWVVALLTVACVGGKASAAIVVLGALGLTMIVGQLRRAPWRGRATVALVAGAIPGGIAYLVVLGGSASSGDLQLLTWAYRASSVQGLNLGSGALGIAAGTAILMIAVVPRWAGMAGYWLDREARWSPSSVLGAGLIVMALVPLALMSQGVNELWFALSASAPLAVLSAVGLGIGWQAVKADTPLASGRRAMRMVLSVACSLAVFAVATVLWVQGETATVSVRAAGPVVALALAAGLAVPLSRNLRAPGRGTAAWVLVVATILVCSSAAARAMTAVGRVGSQTTTSDVPVLQGAVESLAVPGAAPAEAGSREPIVDFGNTWSELEAAAAAYVMANSTAQDVLVTDRTQSAVVPALTRLRTFVSGAPYQALYGRPSHVAEIPGRVAVSQQFGYGPTAADLAQLCASGVTMGWLSGSAGFESSSLMDVVFENDAVTIVRLTPDACG